jgi:arylformamidase
MVFLDRGTIDFTYGKEIDAMKKWIDVSLPLRNGLVHWPGDPPFVIERIKDLEREDPATVSHIAMGVHSGTHMDAPAHFIRGGAFLDAMPPDALVGRGRVVEIEDGQSVTVEELEPHRIRRGERVLFKTRNSDRCYKTDTFVEDFVYISAGAARYLASRGVLCVGIDYLSVGGFFRDGRETHELLLGAGVWIVEGLDLSVIEPGPVDLICLPLRLAGAEGAPARVLLRSLKTKRLPRRRLAPRR